jgi:hypothetical protein
MYRDTDGFPLVGAHKSCLLGVRPTGANADVDLNPPGDVNGDVVVNLKGLSVVADGRQLPGYMIPEHLDDGFDGASGRNMEVFVHGDGTGRFAEGTVSAGLELCFKLYSINSGVIRPTAIVSLAQDQADLQATRAQWMVNES